MIGQDATLPLVCSQSRQWTNDSLAISQNGAFDNRGLRSEFDPI